MKENLWKIPKDFLLEAKVLYQTCPVKQIVNKKFCLCEKERSFRYKRQEFCQAQALSFFGRSLRRCSLS